MVEINEVTFGEVKIDGKIYYSDMIVWWTGEREFRIKSDILHEDEFRKFLEKEPEILIVGTGIIGHLLVPTNVKELAQRKNVELYVESSERAMDLFNAFIADRKHVVVLMHTTG